MSGPKLNAFMAVCGAAAAGLGVVGAALPFLPHQETKAVSASSAPAAKEETFRACSDSEKEVVRAALNNYGRRAVDECYRFTKNREADVSACEVDLVSRRINARGQYKWAGSLRSDTQNFSAAFSTDMSGTDIRVNVTGSSRERDVRCATLEKSGH